MNVHRFVVHVGTVSPERDTTWYVADPWHVFDTAAIVRSGLPQSFLSVSRTAASVRCKPLVKLGS